MIYRLLVQQLSSRDLPGFPARTYLMGPPGEDNSNARMKHRISGRKVVADITDGQLTFGIWERIFQGEFNG